MFTIVDLFFFIINYSDEFKTNKSLAMSFKGSKMIPKEVKKNIKNTSVSGSFAKVDRERKKESVSISKNRSSIVNPSVERDLFKRPKKMKLPPRDVKNLNLKKDAIKKSGLLKRYSAEQSNAEESSGKSRNGCWSESVFEQREENRLAGCD